MHNPHSFVYKLVLVADGNFKADHVRQQSDGDVWLVDGAGMSPNRQEYFTFLASAIERFTVRIFQTSMPMPMPMLMPIPTDIKCFQQKAPCENTFRAIQNALLASKACDLTGVVGIACARHGCFVPNTLVDLFKGEQQKNVDFAFLKALDIIGVDPEQGVLLIYDIACQYFVYLKERIGNLLPPGLMIDQAIDLFHVHAHKDECFFRFATTFIPGAAVVAGQVIESLWSNLNSISPTVRTATLPHRAEMLDDHTCDSNHKKLLSMTRNLRTRYMDATAMTSRADQYHLDVACTMDRSTLTLWEDEITTAESRRSIDVKVMDIYAARVPDFLGPHAASPAESASASASTPLDQWIEFSLLVEDTQ